MNSNLKIETHTVPQLFVRQRLQDYAVGIFRTVHSRAGVKKAIKKGLILINSEIGRTGDWIKGGETLELCENLNQTKPEIDFKLNVLFEDDHLAVIFKPAGILVSGNKRFTIENTLPFNLEKSKQHDALARPEPIHRLDYPTTGALLIGKTVQMVSRLNRLFEERSIRKIYHAVSIGTMNNNGIIDTPVDGKPSKSEFKVLASITSERFTQLNLLELNPHTGRRHQLRKHLAELGNPIFGDATYGKEGLILKGSGLFLHATQLEFIHPVSGKDVIVSAPFPEKFTRLFPEMGLR